MQNVGNLRDQSGRRRFKVVSTSSCCRHWIPFGERATIRTIPGAENFAGRQRNAAIDQQKRSVFKRMFGNFQELVASSIAARNSGPDAGWDVGAKASAYCLEIGGRTFKVPPTHQ